MWRELRLLLELHPARTAKGLLEHLQQKYAGQFYDHQLRTLQRRVREWRRQQLYHREIFEAAGSDETGNTDSQIEEPAVV